MSRYDTNQTGTSPALMEIMNKFNKMPRGVHNETCAVSFDVDPFAMIPFEVFPMFPNSEIDVQYDVSLESINPMIKKIQTAMSAEIYVGYLNNNDIWEGWNNFITGGRTGKVINKEIPHIAWTCYHKDSSNNITAWTSCLASSPSYLMGIAPCAWIPTGTVADNNVNEALNYKRGYFTDISKMKTSGLTGISTVAILNASKAMYISALPFVAYVKMVRKFMNQNLLQNYPHWLPENENHELILDYGAEAHPVTNADYDNCHDGYDSTDPFLSSDIASTDSIAFNDEFCEYPLLNRLYHCDRKNDYFNTGSPFPELLRGDIPFIDFASAKVNDPTVASTIDFSDSVGSGSSNFVVTAYNGLLGRLNFNSSTATGAATKEYGLSNTSGSKYGQATSQDVLDALNKAKITSVLSDSTISGINITMSAWRQLAVNTIFRERMARSNGSYNSLIEAQFNWNPQWHGHDIAIVGSHKQPIVFSEVVQQAPNGSSPLGGTTSLGDVAGRSFSDSSSKNIHVRSNDYGIMIAVFILRPDEYYNQGVNKLWSALTQPEQYFPIFNNLSPDATQNRELYVSGTDSDDLNVLNYQERFARYKSRENRFSGYMGLPISKVGDVGCYGLIRNFQSTPNFNMDFVKGKLDENEQLLWSALYQNKFTVNIKSRFRFVAPLPDITVPSDVGLSF